MESYICRTQYNLGKLQDARQSLERALSIYEDDHMADFIWDLREHALVIVPTEREISKPD